jgi:predicted AlkP superfamily phosphohydrolase/phosphomutase
MGIRINLIGEQKAELHQAIVHALEEIVDPETGRKVIEKVCRGEDYYDGPYAGRIPDIIVTANPTYGFNHHLSHYSSIITKRLVASGPAKHRAEGIFIAHGPDILPGLEFLQNLNIEDVAPTVLYLMGLPVPSDMDGRVLTEIVNPVLLRARPIRREGPVGFWPKEDEAVFDNEVMSAEDEELIRDRLQSLGYLE